MVWTGDVWKVILCLKTVRPDLDIITSRSDRGADHDTKLDRNSKLLATQFDTLVAHFMDASSPLHCRNGFSCSGNRRSPG